MIIAIHECFIRVIFIFIYILIVLHTYFTGIFVLEILPGAVKILNFRKVPYNTTVTEGHYARQASWQMNISQYRFLCEPCTYTCT